ncbi:MAG: hypothetical protein IJN80_03565 [Clostridia bacterium]|nr:hypothetical protein [Clostridia bacterium]
MEQTIEQIWREYQAGAALLTRDGYYDRYEECHCFYEGDQWRYLPTDGERLPIYNIIEPIVKYKTAVVAQNHLSLRYGFDTADRPALETIAHQSADLLNTHARVLWEQNQMDQKCWEAVEDGCVSGASYLYFYMRDGQLKGEVLEGVDLLFGDEQQEDLQQQPYIMIIQRRSVEDVQKEARAAGIPEEAILQIRPDTDLPLRERLLENDLPEKRKCTSILKFYKDGNTLCYLRAVRGLIYCPEVRLEGVSRYPIAPFIWARRKGSCRGRGAVEGLIPNQITINKNLVRMDIAIKRFAFPKLVYSAPRIQNVEDIEKVGASIAVDDPNVGIGELISYVQPASINSLAYNFMGNMISTTRELSGAGDAVTGQINPEQASGAAIVAVRDAAVLNLNFAVAQLSRFVEDVALIWFDLLRAYHPAGLPIAGQMIPAGLLKALEPRVRVDLSPANSFSKYAQEQTLTNLLSGGYITFAEYVDALDDDANAPRGKLRAIVEKRALSQENSAKIS